MSDLVERLRKGYPHECNGCADRCEAADRIEALEAALREINKLNSYDRVQRLMRLLTANGEMADYDDEMANTCKIAVECLDIARRALEGKMRSHAKKTIKALGNWAFGITYFVGLAFTYAWVDMHPSHDDYADHSADHIMAGLTSIIWPIYWVNIASRAIIGQFSEGKK